MAFWIAIAPGLDILATQATHHSALISLLVSSTPTNQVPNLKYIHRAPPSTTMPPIQQSLLLNLNNYDIVILTSAILPLLFILLFILAVFLTWQPIARRRGVYGNALHRSTTPSLDLPSPRAFNYRKETLFPLTVSTLVQSTLLASHFLRLGIVFNNLWPLSPAQCSESQPSSWGRKNNTQFGLAFNGDGSRLSDTIWLLPTTLRGLRKRLFLGPFAGLRQQSPGARKSAEFQQPAPDVVETTEATGEPSLDVLEADSAGVPDIFPSTDDAQVETGILPIPLIILSLPSSENLVEDPSPSVSLDKNFLCPDGTFGRPAQVAVRTYDISNTTHVALASCLRHRQKRATPLPSPDVLSIPGVVRWPRQGPRRCWL